MKSANCQCKNTLSFSALRWARRFGDKMQVVLIRALQERQAIKGTLTADDMAECIGMAYTILEADTEARVEFPAPNLSLVERAKKAAVEGQGRTIREILNAIP
jgi:hypothetical protein